MHLKPFPNAIAVKNPVQSTRQANLASHRRQLHMALLKASATHLREAEKAELISSAKMLSDLLDMGLHSKKEEDALRAVLETAVSLNGAPLPLQEYDHSFVISEACIGLKRLRVHDANGGPAKHTLPPKALLLMRAMLHLVEPRDGELSILIEEIPERRETMVFVNGAAVKGLGKEVFDFLGKYAKYLGGSFAPNHSHITLTLPAGQQ